MFNLWSLKLSSSLDLHLAHDTALVLECLRFVNPFLPTVPTFAQPRDWRLSDSKCWNGGHEWVNFHSWWVACLQLCVPPKLCPFLCEYLNMHWSGKSCEQNHWIPRLECKLLDTNFFIALSLSYTYARTYPILKTTTFLKFIFLKMLRIEKKNSR